MRETFKVISIDTEVHVARKVQKSYSFEECRVIEKVIREDSYCFGRATNGARFGSELVVFTFSFEPGSVAEGDLISGEPVGTALRDVYLLMKS
jgi:hypothetical protein